MTWLRQKLGKAFWWVVVLLAALLAFVIYLFIRRTPRWFGNLLDDQDRRRTVEKARADLKKLEVEREKRKKESAKRTTGRLDRWRAWVRKRREKARARGPREG